LSEHGIEPAPERKRQYSWATFIKAHLGVIAGMDFFTVEVVTTLGLVRYHVLFVIDIGSRMVEVVGIVRNPGGEWMKQMARNPLDADDGLFLRGKRYLILDRDPLYTKEFREMLRGAGVKPLLLLARSPNLNAYAERFVLSVKSECLTGSCRWERDICDGPSVSTSSTTTASGTTKVSTTCRSRARPRRQTRMEGCTGASDSVACSTTTTAMRPDRCSILFWDGRGPARLLRVTGNKERSPRWRSTHSDTASLERCPMVRFSWGL
jgi:transposase InsO family protein